MLMELIRRYKYTYIKNSVEAENVQWTVLSYDSLKVK